MEALTGLRDRAERRAAIKEKKVVDDASLREQSDLLAKEAIEEPLASVEAYSRKMPDPSTRRATEKKMQGRTTEPTKARAQQGQIAESIVEEFSSPEGLAQGKTAAQLKALAKKVGATERAGAFAKIADTKSITKKSYAEAIWDVLDRETMAIPEVAKEFAVVKGR